MRVAFSGHLAVQYHWYNQTVLAVNQFGTLTFVFFEYLSVKTLKHIYFFRRNAKSNLLLDLEHQKLLLPAIASTPIFNNVQNAKSNMNGFQRSSSRRVCRFKLQHLPTIVLFIFISKFAFSYVKLLGRIQLISILYLISVCCRASCRNSRIK